MGAEYRRGHSVVCAEFPARLVEMNGEDNHVHFLVEYPPTIQLSRLVNSLKGMSSRLLRKHDFPEVTATLRGSYLWSPSYFAASCGEAPLGLIQKYIEDQRAQPDPNRTMFTALVGSTATLCRKAEKGLRPWSAAPQGRRVRSGFRPGGSEIADQRLMKAR